MRWNRLYRAAVWSAILVLIGIGVVALAWTAERLHRSHGGEVDKLVAWGSVGTAVATVIVAVFAGSAIWAASQEARRSNRGSRASATMEFIYSWRKEAGEQYREIDDHLKARGIPIEEFADLDDRETVRLLREFLEGVEHLALGTQYRAYDGNIVYELTRARVKKLWRTFGAYIEAVQNGDVASGGKHDPQPTAYEHFGRLVRDIERRENREQAQQRRRDRRHAALGAVWRWLAAGPVAIGAWRARRRRERLAARRPRGSLDD